LRRVFHAAGLPPAVLHAACQLLGRRRAARARSALERYAYWHGARDRLDADTWQRLTRGTAILAQTGLAIGAHTVTHPRRPGLEPTELSREVEQPRAEVAEHVEQVPSCFAYPCGRTDTAAVVAVERADVLCACGIERGPNDPGTHLFNLRRVPVHGDSSTLSFAVGLWFGDPDLIHRAAAAVRSLVRRER
jgi:peptidoglycan/xylan/chitin deacetylase (PgdA/CDA1 family)